MSKSLRNTLLLGFVLFTSLLRAGGLEKGFESLEIKDYFKAFKYFEKALFKNPTGGAFGLSLIYAEEKNAYFHLDSAMKYVLFADSAFMSANTRERGTLNELNITRNRIQEHRLEIADIAWSKIQDSDNRTAYEAYLKRYSFSRQYARIAAMRDSLAFIEAKEIDTYGAYRQFIIDYPGAAQREKADSLYALKFFEAKTVDGDVDTYKRFINEFSSNPHADKAYKRIYEEAIEADDIDVYDDHIRSYPKSPYRDDAWLRLSDIYLQDYTKESLTNLLWDFPDFAFKSEIEEEIRFMYAPRFLVVKSGGKVLYDNQGNQVTQEVYDNISEYSEGYAVVSKGGRTGYINKSGAVIIELTYDDALPIRNGLAIVEKNGKYGALNRRGEVVIPLEFEELGSFNDGLIPAMRTGGFVFLNKKGYPAIDEVFEDASDFESGSAVVKIDGAYGLIDVKGNYLIPAEYDWVEHLENGAARVKKNGKMGLWKRPDGLVLDCEHDLVSENSEGTRVVVKGNRLGYIDNSGQYLTKIEFDYTPDLYNEGAFYGDYAKVSLNGARGVINKLGEFVIEPSYLDLGEVRSEIVWYQEANRFGYLDMTGSVMEAVYDAAQNFKQGVAVVGKEGKFGLIDVRGNFLIQPEYDDLRIVDNSEYCIYSKGTEMGVIHRNGQVHVSGQYDDIEVLFGRYSKMKKGDRFSYFDVDKNQEIYMIQ